MARTLGAGVVMPEGARSSFVAPRILAVRVLDLDAAVLFLDDDLAEMVGTFLRLMNRTLGSPPFNFMLHTAPLREGAVEYFHWHLEIIPKLTRVAGYEWGSGFFINPAPPEDAAEALRAAAP